MRKGKFYDVDQNSDDWFKMRSGKLTSSKLSVVMANHGGGFTASAKRYACNIAIEQITGMPILNGYTNSHMKRGHEQEPIARDLYEKVFFCAVTNGGFFDAGFIGCSPDGLVDKDGAIEIKSVIPSTHYDTIVRGTYDPCYKWQLLSNLKYSGRKWIDFVSFCADFPIDKQLFVHRIYRRKCYPKIQDY